MKYLALSVLREEGEEADPSSSLMTQTASNTNKLTQKETFIFAVRR